MTTGMHMREVPRSSKILCADMINLSKMSCRLQSKHCNSVKHWSHAFKKIRCLVDKVGISEENGLIVYVGSKDQGKRTFSQARSKEHSG